MLFQQYGLSGGKSKLTQYLSRDSSMVASVFTVDYDGNGNTESKVEFRTRKGELIAAKSFMSGDRAHGLGVIKAAWTLDSEFFVFIAIASGGQESGHFPTFFFDRSNHQLYMIEKLLNGNVTDPEFELEYPDGIIITIRDRLPSGKSSEAITRTVYLSKLKEK